MSPADMDASGRNVSGILFLDYVRMIRAAKRVDWRAILDPRDVRWLDEHVDLDGWYSMAIFERLGSAILKGVAGGDMNAVRAWGRFSADPLAKANPSLVEPGNAMRTIDHFRNLRATYFDFEALAVLTLSSVHAQIQISYHMGDPAEEAASWQTMGFFERLVELAGGANVQAAFLERVWDGDRETVLELTWRR